MVTLKQRGKVWWGYYNQPLGFKKRKKVWVRLSEIKWIAQKKANELSDLIRAKKYNHAPTKTSWETFCAEYLKIHSSANATLSKVRDQAIIKVFNETVPTTSLQEITAKTLQLFIARRKEKVKDSTINRELNTLKRMSKVAKQWGYLTIDPWADVHKITLEEAHPQYFDHNQSKDIYQFCSDAYERTIHNLGTLQGLRPGVMCLAKWEGVDWKEETLKIEIVTGRRANPKKKTINMALHPQTIKDLKELKKEIPGQRWILGLHDREPVSRYVCRVYKRLLERCGIKGSLYRTRHTFGSGLVESGTQMRVIQKLMGHSKIATTQIYTHPTEEAEKQAIKSLPSHS